MVKKESHSCSGCAARESIIITQAAQIKDLHDRMLSLVPEAMDRYHRLRMTEMAQTRPEVMNGVMPITKEEFVSEDQALNEWMGQFKTA